MKLNIQWKKVLYGIILIVIGIILAALHFIVAGDGIRDFIDVYKRQGTITVTSGKKKKGSTFVIQLPYVG